MANITKKSNGTYLVRISCGSDAAGKNIIKSRIFKPSKPNLTHQKLNRELDAFVEKFLERYVDFTGSNKNTRHTTYNALIKHVVEGSDLAKRLKDAIAGLQFGQSKGDEIVSIDTHLRIRLDDKFLVDITYEVDTTGKEGVVRTTTNARLLIVKSGNTMKVESIIIY